MTCNIPNPYLVSINAYTKFGKILSIGSQDIEWKQNYEVDGWNVPNPVLHHIFQSGL